MNKTSAITITSIVVLLFGVFFLYPVAMTLAVAFKNEQGHFTFDYLIGVFSNPVYVEGLWNSLMVGVFSTLLSLIIALPLALASHRWLFPGKKLLCILILAPLVLPPFVGAVGIKHILGVSGSLNAFLIDMGMMNTDKPIDWLREGRFWGVVLMNAKTTQNHPTALHARHLCRLRHCLYLVLYRVGRTAGIRLHPCCLGADL